MDTTAHGPIVDLSEDECLRRLATRPVGRVAWTGARGPSIVPVNFVVVDREVRIRTAPYSALSRECDDSPVAFEVDDYDPGSRTGWSVVVRGRARLGLTQPGEPAVHAWPTGSKAAQLVIEVDEVSGRRLDPASR